MPRGKVEIPKLSPDAVRRMVVRGGVVLVVLFILMLLLPGVDDVAPTEPPRSRLTPAPQLQLPPPVRGSAARRVTTAAAQQLALNAEDTLTTTTSSAPVVREPQQVDAGGKPPAEVRAAAVGHLSKLSKAAADSDLMAQQHQQSPQEVTAAPAVPRRRVSDDDVHADPAAAGDDAHRDKEGAHAATAASAAVAEHREEGAGADDHDHGDHPTTTTTTTEAPPAPTTAARRRAAAIVDEHHDGGDDESVDRPVRPRTAVSPRRLISSGDADDSASVKAKDDPGAAAVTKRSSQSIAAPGGDASEGASGSSGKADSLRRRKQQSSTSDADADAAAAAVDVDAPIRVTKAASAASTTTRDEDDVAATAAAVAAAAKGASSTSSSTAGGAIVWRRTKGAGKSDEPDDLVARAVPPCLRTVCPREKYTQFRHYELCGSLEDAAVALKVNASVHDLRGVMELRYTGAAAAEGSGDDAKAHDATNDGRRSEQELKADERCDPSTGQLGPSRAKSYAGGKWSIPSRPTLEICADPRYPLRLPLGIHSINSGPNLACYARGDMVCDIVGRTGGWESELTFILIGALSSMKEIRVQQITNHRHKGLAKLAGKYGKEAVERALLTEGVSPIIDAVRDHIRDAKAYSDELFKHKSPLEAHEALRAAGGGKKTKLPKKERAARQFVAAVGPGALDANWGLLPAIINSTLGQESRGAAAAGASDAYRRQWSTGQNVLSYAEQGTLFGEAVRDPADRARANFDVEYIDIGANVGAFLLHFWRHGYPVTAFEALPYNMQLLSTSLCLNGLRRPMFENDAIRASEGADVAERAGKHQPQQANRVESRRGTSPTATGPSVAVHHTALGKERDLKCVMMSEDLNFGDTWISCNRTHVESTSEFPFENYRKRGSVSMTTLDSLATGERSVMDHDASTRHAALRLVDIEAKRVAKFLATSSRESLDSDTSSSSTDGDASAGLGQQPPLPLPAEDFLAKDYIAKIDVEGHEIAVVEGATELLADRQRRPRLWLSEVWKKLNLTRYAEVMLGAGYVGLAPMKARWLMSIEDATVYHQKMTDDMDNIVWVEPELAAVLMRNFGRTFPGVAAVHRKPTTTTGAAAAAAKTSEGSSDSSPPSDDDEATPAPTTTTTAATSSDDDGHDNSGSSSSRRGAKSQQQRGINVDDADAPVLAEQRPAGKRPTAAASDDDDHAHEETTRTTAAASGRRPAAAEEGQEDAVAAGSTRSKRDGALLEPTADASRTAKPSAAGDSNVLGDAVATTDKNVAEDADPAQQSTTTSAASPAHLPVRRFGASKNSDDGVLIANDEGGDGAAATATAASAERDEPITSQPRRAASAAVRKGDGDGAVGEDDSTAAAAAVGANEVVTKVSGPAKPRVAAAAAAEEDPDDVDRPLTLASGRKMKASSGEDAGVVAGASSSSTESADDEHTNSDRGQPAAGAGAQQAGAGEGGSDD